MDITISEEEYRILKEKAFIFDQMKLYGVCCGCRFQGSYWDCEKGCKDKNNFQLKTVNGDT